ncbi:MAG: sulfotransferase family protein [Planctomycetota bacterium]
MNTPNFFIVGAPKCGTTAMDRYLAEHPEIFMCPRKECHYFGSDLRIAYDRPTEAEYRAYFDEADDARRIGESSVCYLVSERAAEEIAAFSPDAKIVIMLRNPVDMMVSLHSQLCHNAEETVTDFEAALAEEADRRAGKFDSLPTPRIPQAFCYRHMARYPQQVKRYYEVFGPDNVHVIIFDDLKANTPGVYRDVLEFLGVDPTFAPTFERINANTSARWPRLQQLILASPFGRSYRLRRMIPGVLRRMISGLNSKVHERAPMAPALRRALTDEFAPVVSELSDLLKRDLTHWSRER